MREPSCCDGIRGHWEFGALGHADKIAQVAIGSFCVAGGMREDRKGFKIAGKGNPYKQLYIE